LGCGTLILIAIIVGLVTNSIRNDVAQTNRELAQLQAAVERLERASAQQLEEIRMLRQEAEERGLRTAPRN
jgi:hypothetical protein